jgi:uncharacterized protein YcgI (DUF1989 family)
MEREFLVDCQTGSAFKLGKGESVTIVDLEGKQVADFFAYSADATGEFLSTGVTIDVNGSLKIHQGDRIYTNLYRPMFQVIDDDVQEHDLLYPSCRQEMYEFLYGSEPGHPNCHDNLNDCLAQFGFAKQGIIHPFNVFMHTAILPDGRIAVEEPASKPGDRIKLRAEMDVVVGIAACSASESKCNGGKCTGIKVIIHT